MTMSPCRALSNARCSVDLKLTTCVTQDHVPRGQHAARCEMGRRGVGGRAPDVVELRVREFNDRFSFYITCVDPVYQAMSVRVVE